LQADGFAGFAEQTKKAGGSSTPGLKTSRKKGIRDVSLKARRHRECEKADL